MTQVNCEFIGREISHILNEPRFEIVSHHDGVLIINVHCMLASGVHYEAGSAEIIDGQIHLTTQTRSDPEIAFEQLPWRLTFTLQYDEAIDHNVVYFDGEPIKKLLQSPAKTMG